MIVKAAPLFATILCRWFGLESLLAIAEGVEDRKLKGHSQVRNPNR
jgi:hypothetical protein